MKKSFVLGVFIILLSVSLVIAGVPDFQAVNVAPSSGHAAVTIPENAVEVAPGIFDLGSAVDPATGKIAQGYAIIHYGNKRANAKPPWAGGGNNNGETKCYTFLARGAKWKTVENYSVDSSNLDGLSAGFISNNIADDIDAWENASGANILGDEVSGVINHSTIGDLNGKNEVVFGDISSSGAIAVTIVWGIFGGPPQGRELVEWDQVYDDVDFDWTEDALIETDKMDFWNIAIHELGHSVGLGDLYQSECSEETMYGYGTEGETQKRDLNAGDIAGVKELYK